MVYGLGIAMKSSAIAIRISFFILTAAARRFVRKQARDSEVSDSLAEECSLHIPMALFRAETSGIGRVFLTMGYAAS